MTTSIWVFASLSANQKCLASKRLHPHTSPSTHPAHTVSRSAGAICCESSDPLITRPARRTPNPTPRNSFPCVPVLPRRLCRPRQAPARTSAPFSLVPPDPRRSLGSELILCDEGLEDLPALQELEPAVELRVGAELTLLHALGRDVGGVGLVLVEVLRRRLLPLGMLEVAREIRLAQRRRPRALHLRDLRALIHRDVGHDAGRLDGAATRRVVARRREPQRR